MKKKFRSRKIILGSIFLLLGIFFVLFSKPGKSSEQCLYAGYVDPNYCIRLAFGGTGICDSSCGSCEDIGNPLPAACCPLGSTSSIRLIYSSNSSLPMEPCGGGLVTRRVVSIPSSPYEYLYEYLACCGPGYTACIGDQEANCCPPGSTCNINGTCTPSCGDDGGGGYTCDQACIDLDEGASDEYQEASGGFQVYTNCSQPFFEDYCENDYTLKEFQCDQQMYFYEEINCSTTYGSTWICQDGRCIDSDSPPPPVTPPYPPYLLFVNISGGYVEKAKVGSNGSMAIAGIVSQNYNGTLSPDGDDFAIQNNDTREYTVLLDSSSGNLYLKGRLYTDQSSLTPPQGSFQIKNSNNEIVAYFTKQGDLYLKEDLIENAYNF